MFQIYVTFISAAMLLFMGAIWSKGEIIDKIIKTALLALAFVNLLLGLKAVGVL